MRWTNPPHDRLDPMSEVNGLEAVALAATLPSCPHCERTANVVPMTGNGWGVEQQHERGCPDHEDSQPAAEAGPDDYPDPAA